MAPRNFICQGHQIGSYSTGCTTFYLTEGHRVRVKHFYGPEGYTKYYLWDEFIYGPSPALASCGDLAPCTDRGLWSPYLWLDES